jgi:hypothetical protein
MSNPISFAKASSSHHSSGGFGIEVSPVPEINAHPLRRNAAENTKPRERTHPAQTHFATRSFLLKRVGTAGNLTTDAHLAALAIERGLILQTTDADFARFSGLKWNNPLASISRQWMTECAWCSFGRC